MWQLHLVGHCADIYWVLYMYMYMYIIYIHIKETH